MIFWDKEQWGKIVKSATFTTNILPSFYELWQQQSQLQLDYVYLIQDNASPQLARHTQSHLKDLRIWRYFIDWPPSSPDCNPIENVWRLKKQQIRKRNPFPAIMGTLKVAIQEEWNSITPEELTSLVDSIPTCVREVSSSHSLASQISTTTSLVLIQFFSWALQVRLTHGGHSGY